MGGGVYASGTFIARGSTISGNSTTAANGKTPGGNGGNSTGGGIWTVKELNLESTTVSGNSAMSPGSAGQGGFPGVATGGGIHAQSGRTDLNGVTLASNVATSGGDLYAGTGAAEVYLESSIIAYGGSFSNCAVSPGAAFITSQGHNLGTDASCNLVAGTDIGGDPSLGPLQANGGLTETRAIPKSSPAVDTGVRSAGLQSLLGITATGDFTDQRGFTRPLDFADEPNAANGDGSDIGAFELQQALPEKSLTITAKPKRVQKNDKTTLIATVGPCPLAQGELVTFQRKQGDQFGQIGSSPLPAEGSKCRAELETKVKKKSVYRAISPESGQLSDATSKKVTVEVK
jgi:hypothetical protein